MGIYDSAYSPIMGSQWGIVPSNTDMMLRNMGFGSAFMGGGVTSGLGLTGDQNNGAPGPGDDGSNDGAAGLAPDVSAGGMMGKDLFSDFKDMGIGKIGAMSPEQEAAAGKAAAGKPSGGELTDAAKAAKQGTTVPGLPGISPAAGTGPSQADIDAAHNSPAGVPGSQHNSPNAVGGLMSGAEAAAAAAAAAESAAPAGVPGSEQNSPNAVGGVVGGMAANGMATGVTSGEHGLGGMGGGGGGSGGGGEGGVGQGAGSGPSGTDPGGQAGGVGGVGQGGMGMGGGQGEGGNGGWRVGTAQTGDDGDMMLDEPVEGQVHENEAVLPRELRSLIGPEVIDQWIKVARSGLPENHKRALIRALWS